MNTTYHPSRSAARDAAKINNGKVIDLGVNAKARWAVESEEATVTVRKSGGSKLLETLAKVQGRTFDEAMIACGALVYPEKKLPANARILVSRNKREGKAFVKFGRGEGERGCYVRGEFAQAIRAIRRNS